MEQFPIYFPQDEINRFCETHHISRLGLFGSILTDHFTHSSDLDFLVEFEPDHIPTLFGIAEMELELKRLFDREVDLRTPNDLSPYFRDDVIGQSVKVYGRKGFKSN